MQDRKGPTQQSTYSLYRKVKHEKCQHIQMFSISKSFREHLHAFCCEYSHEHPAPHANPNYLEQRIVLLHLDLWCFYLFIDRWHWAIPILSQSLKRFLKLTDKSDDLLMVLGYELCVIHSVVYFKLSPGQGDQPLELPAALIWLYLCLHR